MIGHDVEALVDLATKYKDKWGDSCHHALAEHILVLKDRIAALGVELDSERRSKAEAVERMAHYRGTPCKDCI